MKYVKIKADNQFKQFTIKTYDIERDANMIEEAEIIYTAISKLLSKKDRDKYLDGFSSGHSSGDNYDGYLLNLHDIPSIKKLIPPVNIILFFSKKSDNRSGSFSDFGTFGKGSKVKSIDLNILEEKDLKNYSTSISKKFSSNEGKRIFIHEYIHLLDNLKYKTGIPKIVQPEEGSKYFSNPHEFNAHFLQFISSFEDGLDDMNIARKLEILSDNKYTRNHIIDSFLLFKPLEGVYKNKLKKRAYLYVEKRLPVLLKKELKKLNSVKGIDRLIKDIKTDVINKKGFFGGDRWIDLIVNNPVKFSEDIDLAKNIIQFLDSKHKKLFDSKLDELKENLK